MGGVISIASMAATIVEPLLVLFPKWLIGKPLASTLMDTSTCITASGAYQVKGLKCCHAHGCPRCDTHGCFKQSCQHLAVLEIWLIHPLVSESQVSEACAKSVIREGLASAFLNWA